MGFEETSLTRNESIPARRKPPARHQDEPAETQATQQQPDNSDTIIKTETENVIATETETEVASGSGQAAAKESESDPRLRFGFHMGILKGSFRRSQREARSEEHRRQGSRRERRGAFCKGRIL